MAFTQLTNNLNIIQALDDQPNDVGGLTAAQVKAKFDEAGNTIKVYINDTLIAELEAATAAASLGITAPSGLTGTNIQAVIEDLVSKVLLKTNTTAYTPTADYHPATKKYIDDSLTGVVLGQLPDNSITNAKLGTDIKVGSLASLTTTEKSTVVGAINEVDADLAAHLAETTQAHGGIVSTEQLNTIKSDIARIKDNLILNFFRDAIDEARSVQRLEDGIVDEFEDETGINTESSTGEIYNATYNYYSNIELIEQTLYDTNSTHGDSNDQEYRAAQSFTLAAESTIIAVELFFGTSGGTPQGPVTLRIETLSSGLPSGTLANQNLTKALTPTPNAWNTFTFDTPATLAAGTYAIVPAISNQPTSSYWSLNRKDTTNPYSGGVAFTSSDGGESWSQLTDTDLAFKVHINNNMILISQAFAAETEPTTARIIIFEEDISSVTINTDLKAYVSKDNGSTWNEVTLIDKGDYDTGGKRILAGDVELINGTGGTQMVWKITTNTSINNKGLKIHGVALLWA